MQYRVIATTTVGFTDPEVKTTVKWQGADLDELSREFPPSDIFGADPLEQHELEGGFIITRHTFEQFEGDSWQKIDDPRRRITPVTAYEHAIDAENRRLFPGDYITGDEYDECEDGCTRCGDRGCEACMPDSVCAKCERWDPNLYGGLCYDCDQDYLASLDAQS